MTAKKSTAKKADTRKATKATKKPAKAKAPAAKKLSALDAAARVLAETGTAMTTGELIEAMAEKKLWQSPNGKTPSATLYAAILRELNTKGKDSRFKKTEPGKFAATAAAKDGAAGEAPPALGKKTAKPKVAKGGKEKAAEPAEATPAAPTAEAPAA